jgi:GTP pyrophosphokinase
VGHSLEVARIVASLGMDAEAVAAAVLHDTVEDTGTNLEDIRLEFGPGVASLVDGVTKMGRIGEYASGTRDNPQAENLRKLLLAMAEDARVVLIKLADRLHNMRTLKHLDAARQNKIARETMEIYAPLANRLGIWQLKWELEDLALRYLEPESYREIAGLLDARRVDRERHIRIRQGRAARRGDRPAETYLQHLAQDEAQERRFSRDLRRAGGARAGGSVQ